MGKLVKEMMSAKPVLISKNASAQEAAQKMTEADVGVLPVWDDKLGAIVGMVTDRDITKGMANRGTVDFMVNEVMSQGVHHINEDAEVTAAAHYMGEKQLRRLMVTNREKKFVGIISLGDIRTQNVGFQPEELVTIVYEVTKGRQYRRGQQKERAEREGISEKGQKMEGQQLKGEGKKPKGEKIKGEKLKGEGQQLKGEGQKPKGEKVKGQKLEGEQFKGEGQQLKGEQFKGEGQQLKGEQMKGQKLKGEQMKGQKLEGQQLKGEQFKGEGQQLKGEQMKGQQLEGQQLKGEQFKGEGQKLEGQQLKGQQFERQGEKWQGKEPEQEQEPQLFRSFLEHQQELQGGQKEKFKEGSQLKEGSQFQKEGVRQQQQQQQPPLQTSQ